MPLRLDAFLAQLHFHHLRPCDNGSVHGLPLPLLVSAFVSFGASSIAKHCGGAASSYELFLRPTSLSGCMLALSRVARRSVGTWTQEDLAHAGRLWQKLVMNLQGCLQVELLVVRRLHAGKGGFGKQLVRTGRMYASAKRREARNGGGNAPLTRNLQGEMNTRRTTDADAAGGEAADRKRHRAERVAAAEAASLAREHTRQVAAEREVRLAQESAVAAALQAAVTAGFAALVAQSKPKAAAAEGGAKGAASS